MAAGVRRRRNGVARLSALQSLRARRGWHTRRVYLYEELLYWGGADQPIHALRRLARAIWRETTGRRDRCPEVVAGRGVWDGFHWVSYCEGRHTIVLARSQRKRCVLIHEMVHALGPVTHGPRFQNLYAILLEKYL